MLFFRQDSGQTLAEYVLAGGLVALVAIVGLTMISGNLSSSLPGLLDRIFGDGGGAPTTQAGGGNTGGGNTNPGSGNPNLPPTTGSSWPNTETVCMSNVCVNLPIVTRGDLETAGGMGGSDLTQAFADVIRQIADQLEDYPNLDPALLQKIRELANYGHEISYEQRYLGYNVQSVCNGASACDLATTNAVWDPLQLLPMRDTDQDGRPDAMNDFSTLLYELLNDPAAANLPPGVMDIIAFEANQIENLANGTTWIDPQLAQHFNNNYSQYGYYNGYNGSYYDPYYNGNSMYLSAENGAEVVEQNANTICAGGKGGPQCTRHNGQQQTGNNNNSGNTGG